MSAKECHKISPLEPSMELLETCIVINMNGIYQWEQQQQEISFQPPKRMNLQTFFQKIIEGLVSLGVKEKNSVYNNNNNYYYYCFLLLFFKGENGIPELPVIYNTMLLVHTFLNCAFCVCVCEKRGKHNGKVPLVACYTHLTPVHLIEIL